MYIDGKVYVSNIIKSLSVSNNEFKNTSVDDISWFGRMVHFVVRIDLEKLKIPDRDTKQKVESIREIYEDLETKLKNIYIFSDIKLQHGSLMGFPVGNEKILSCPEEVYLVAYVDTSRNNADSLYLKICGNENTQQTAHKNVLEYVIATLNTHKNKLCTFQGYPFNHELNNNGTFWQIDLQKIPLYKKLTTNISTKLISGNI